MAKSVEEIIQEKNVAKTIKDKANYIKSSDFQKMLDELSSNPAFAQQLDDNLNNPWADNRDILKGNISRIDAMGLQLTGYIRELSPPMADLSQGTKKVVQKFFENAIGNNQLNSFLKQNNVREINHSDYFTNPDTIKEVAYFAYKTRNLNKVEGALDKLTKVHESALAGVPILNDNKLTLKEFAIVSDLAKTFNMLEKLNKAGFIEGSEKLEKIYQSAKKAQEIIANLEKETNKDLQNAGPGILVLDHTVKKSHVTSSVLKFFERVVNLFVKHGHASMLYSTSEGEVQQSHLLRGGVKKHDFDINKQLYANMYQIDPIALISDKNRQLLGEKYGENWQEKILNKFKIIENDLHTQSHVNFSGLTARNASTGIKAGLADLVPFGHKKFKANDFEELHRKVVDGKGVNRQDMLCSAFTAITIATSMVELNKQIQQDTGLTGEVVKVPFGKHENLGKMHPDRLESVLRSFNCIKPVITKSADYIKEEAMKIVQNSSINTNHTNQYKSIKQNKTKNTVFR